MAKSAEETFSIKNTTKSKLPSLPFVSMKNSALGKKYDLSLTFIGDSLSRKLNRTYRSKDKPTNILSFELDDMNGEIFINLKKAKSEAKNFGRTYQNFIGFLFIHGLIHLKGFEHSSTMEHEENKLRKKFKI